MFETAGKTALADIDKANAMIQELDADEMEKITGGGDRPWCLSDYYCVYLFHIDTICVLELPDDFYPDR